MSHTTHFEGDSLYSRNRYQANGPCTGRYREGLFYAINAISCPRQAVHSMVPRPTTQLGATGHPLGVKAISSPIVQYRPSPLVALVPTSQTRWTERSDGKGTQAAPIDPYSTIGHVRWMHHEKRRQGIGHIGCSEISPHCSICVGR